MNNIPAYCSSCVKNLEHTLLAINLYVITPTTHPTMYQCCQNKITLVLTLCAHKLHYYVIMEIWYPSQLQCFDVLHKIVGNMKQVTISI